MTAARAHTETVLPKPARTPAAIRAVLVANAPADLVQAFDKAWDAAYTQARETDSIQPLNEMLNRWWFEASDWCDPAAHRAFLAKMDDWAANGVPADQRVSSEQVLEALESKHGKGSMGPVWDKLAGRV